MKNIKPDVQSTEYREVEDILNQIRERSKVNKSPKVNGVTREQSRLTLDEIRAKFTNSNCDEPTDADIILKQIRDLKTRAALKGKDDWLDWYDAEKTGNKETASAVLERVQKARAEDKVRRDIHYTAPAGPGVGIISGGPGPSHTHTLPNDGEMVTISSNNFISVDPETMRRIEKLEKENEYYRNKLHIIDSQLGTIRECLKEPGKVVHKEPKYKITNEALIREMNRSFWGEDGMTNELQNLLKALVDRMLNKSQFKMFRFRDEMRALAYERVCDSWKSHRNTTDNPFALFVQIAKKAFHEVLQEKKLEYRESSYDRAMEVLE